MVTFLHTADWQLGMTRRWLAGEAQARFTDARLQAVRALGRVAQDTGCEFVVVSGDVFEANQLSGQTIRRAFEAMASIPVPVYLLPGNHDPLDAMSIYRSALFTAECPANVRVLDRCGPVPVRDGVELVAAPWESKYPGEDLVAGALARIGEADGTVRIVVGHGAVDTLDPDRDNVATIALAPLEEAVRAGRIHYVALGDRHSRTEVGRSGAVYYSGAPEVTDFRESEPGDVLVVRVEHGRPAQVEPHHVGRWSFHVWRKEMRGGRDVTALDTELSDLPDKDRTVVRMALRGALGLADNARLNEVLTRHGQVLASLHLWDRHHDLRVIADGAELQALGLGGFLAGAAEEIRELAVPPARDEPADEADPDEAADLAESTNPAGPSSDAEDAHREADPLDWHFDAGRIDDEQSAGDALALLYQLSGGGTR